MVDSELDGSEMVELSGRMMLVSVICLFFFFFFLVACIWFWRRRPNLLSTAAERRRGDPQEVGVRISLRRGLDPSVLKTIPEVEFSSKDFKDGLECAVCLCEVCEGEKARLLPKCNHGFHVDCIDTWFQSHSTCPLCRNPISHPNSPDSELVPIPGPSSGAPNFPTNVLFWGDETQVSTLGPPTMEEPSQDHGSSQVPCSSTAETKLGSAAQGMLAIDIPSQIFGDDEPRESPMITRLRSLKRLLSIEMRVFKDLEQGGSSQF